MRIWRVVVDASVAYKASTLPNDWMSSPHEEQDCDAKKCKEREINAHIPISQSTSRYIVSLSQQYFFIQMIRNAITHNTPFFNLGSSNSTT